MTNRIGRWLWCAPWVVLLVAALDARADDPPADFARGVPPVLINRCLECHNSTDRSGGLDLSTRDGLRKGGKTGPALTPGDPDDSLLLQRIVDGEMPPEKQGKRNAVPADEVERLRRWVAAGAPWPGDRPLDPFEVSTETRGGRDHWSLQPVRRPTVPVLGSNEDAINPIDAFILQRLAPRGWTLAPAADRRTLIKRVYHDLVGYPPAFDDVEAFAADPAPDAYERLVDRLLASPHFGERWGRYWLDVARYAETCGYERDQVLPGAWSYRDWVVRAMNDDMPFDQFAVQQLAGDEIADRSESSVTATGFLRLGTWNDEPNDPQEYKYERLEDMVHATSTAFLAMTVKCARCHDHKFDPVRQTDYYRMAAAFWAGPIEPGPRERLGGPDEAALGYRVLGWTDRGRVVPPLHLLMKGDPNKPGPVVEPGQLSMLPALDRPNQPPSVGARGTERRLQLSRWIVDPANPLTPRVWVNRIWQHHFGQGLVRSPDNFGFTGDRPTHPELLDWLASELHANGWRTKPLHRLMLLSRTYRQSSIHPQAETYERDDASNHLWWRAERRRRDAESLRDALLTASGTLDRSKIGGPSFAPTIAAEALEGLSMKSNAWSPSPPEQQRRRAVYTFVKRGLLPPLATTFDLPDTTLPCGRRDETLVAPQALALMNNALVHEQSERLARQIMSESADDASRVRAAWRRILTREPTSTETTAAVAHLGDQAQRYRQAGDADPAARALASLCHVLLNANEFLFVD